MKINEKTTVFRKINLIDLTVLAIIVLFLFIAIKFTYFRPNFFHYENLTVDILFNKSSLSNMVLLNYLTAFSNGTNFWYLDDSSYLLLYQNESAMCFNQKKGTELIYYFNGFYSIPAKRIQVHCDHNIKSSSTVYYSNNSLILLPNTTSFGCLNLWTGEKLTYYFNDSYISLPKELVVDCMYYKKNIVLSYSSGPSSSFSYEIKAIKCTYNETNITYFYFNTPIQSMEDYLCIPTFRFKFRARIIGGEPFYKQSHLSKGRYFDVRIGNISMQMGKIIAVYNDSDRMGEEE